MSYVPALLGATLVVLGVAAIFWPAALIVAGGFLLLLDSRLTLPKRKPGRPTGRQLGRVEVR